MAIFARAKARHLGSLALPLDMSARVGGGSGGVGLKRLCVCSKDPWDLLLRLSVCAWRARPSAGGAPVLRVRGPLRRVRRRRVPRHTAQSRCARVPGLRVHIM